MQSNLFSYKIEMLNVDVRLVGQLRAVKRVNSSSFDDAADSADMSWSVSRSRRRSGLHLDHTSSSQQLD